MKRILGSTVVVLFIALAVGAMLRPSLLAQQDTARKKYVCPPCGCHGDDDVQDQPGTCSFCAMPLVEQTAALSELTVIPAFLKLNDQLWTGGQPTLEHLTKLKAEGVKVIINLRPHNEHNGEREEAKAKELGLQYFNLPIVYNQPKDEDADAFLKLTDEHLNEGRVFLHCAAAIRVGGFWMIRRVLRDDWTFDQALEEANKIGLRNRSHLVEFARSYVNKRQKK